MPKLCAQTDMRIGSKPLKLKNNKTPDSFLVKYRRCLWEILHLSRRSEMMRGNRRVKPQWRPAACGITGLDSAARPVNQDT